MIENNRRNVLHVPFGENDLVKALGAKWDISTRHWYVPQGLDAEPFARWGGAPGPLSTDPRELFADVLRQAGLLLDGLPEMDGKLRRARVEGDKGQARGGAYLGHLDGVPAGFFQNFKTGEKRSWRFEGRTRPLGPAERQSLLHEVAEKQHQREVARCAIHAETMALLTGHFAAATPAPADHPYLLAKDIEPHGSLIDRAGPLLIPGGEKWPQRWSASGNLLIPIRTVDGELIGAQSIAPDGRKSLPRGGTLSGGVHLMGDQTSINECGVVIAEGYATAATIRELTGLAAAAAFSANNLEAAARACRHAWPDAPIAIAGDNDHQKERQHDARGRPKPNVGRIAAEQAAKAVGGVALIPSFSADDPGSDWNDVAGRGGKAEFLRQWTTQLTAANHPLQVAAESRRFPRIR